MAGRSPSPNSRRPRTLDANNPLRRSKDNLQRNPALKSQSQRSSSLEQNENEQKRSLIHNSKVSKNFMAPTISAASKFTPSPSRRKVLQERNEVENTVSKSLEFPITNEFRNNSFDFGTKPNMGFVNQDVSKSFEAKSENLEKINHKRSSPLPQNAALDADTTLPPYDPKTNYLSPRPQFLHYRPKPRNEHYFSDVNDVRSLEDSFSTESSEVDDEKERETELESSDESFHCDIEKNESDLKLKSECVNATESKCESEILDLSESKCESESEILDESKSEPKSTKFCYFRRSGLISFILILLLTFINVPLSDTPIITSSSTPNTYSPNYRIFDSYLNVANRLKQLSVDYFTYFATLNSPKVHVGSYSFVNMTHSVVDELASITSLSYERETAMKEEFKEIDLELPQESDIDFGDNIEAENLHTESEMHELVNMNVSENDFTNEIHEDAVNQKTKDSEIEATVYEDVKDEQMENEIFDILYANIVKPETMDSNNELEHEVKKSEIILEDVREQVEKEIFDSNGAELQTSALHGELYIEAKDNEAAVEDASTAMNLAVVCGLLLSLVAVAAACFVCKVKGKHFQNGKQNVDSGSSEMGCSFSNAARNNEKRRRDSTASSSSSFVSYGSYTTYERISAKKGNKEEEVVTPVRRSSRIKQLISP